MASHSDWPFLFFGDFLSRINDGIDDVFKKYETDNNKYQNPRDDGGYYIVWDFVC